MDTNEVVRATIIWDLEETLKKRDAEIERLREACHRNLDVTNALMQDNMRLREIIGQYKMRQDMLVKALDAAFDDLYAHDAREQAEKITRVLEELEL